MHTPPHDSEGPSAADSGIFGLTCPPDEAEVILVPVPFDATTSYHRGAAAGPQAILRASHQLDLFDSVHGDLSPRGIALVPEDPAFARLNEQARQAVDALRAAREEDGGAGDSARAEIDTLCDEVNQRVRAQVERWLDRGRVVGVVGGDHASPFGSIAAHLERYPKAGILHVDAHADLRDAYEGLTWSHASILYNVLERCDPARLVQVGIRDYAASERRRIDGDPRVTTWFMDDLEALRLSGTPFAELTDRILASLPTEVYVTFDIDGLDPAYCPHTGTPVPGGLSWAEAVFLLRAVVRSGRTLVGFDLNEVAPGPDGDEYDANVGARLLYQLCTLALASRGA